jgi:phosphoserine phosphatase
MAGELNFETALNESVSMLKGKATAFIDKMVAEKPLDNGASTFVRSMRAHGALLSSTR